MNIKILENKLQTILENDNFKITKENIADKKRKAYHNYFCEGKWGDSRNYDISVNSSVLGIEETAEILIDFIDRKRNA